MDKCLTRTTELYSTIHELPVTVIADHNGGLLGPSKLEGDVKQDPTGQPGFSALIRLAKDAKVLIKISGLYRSSVETATNFADMGFIIRELASQVPDSLIWGSDWPHTGEGKDRLSQKDLSVLEPFRTIDNAALLAHIREWVGTEENWNKMLVSNPQRAFA